jgi:NADH dehydrogenase FAD-containing subunit
MTTILVLGGNFGGMTSAFELQRKLRTKARVVVLSRQKEFVYIPSLIWVPFGRRTLKDITFSAEETFRHGGIEFVHDEAVQIRPEANLVHCASGPGPLVRLPDHYHRCGAGMGLHSGTWPDTLHTFDSSHHATLKRRTRRFRIS